jgi:hypothetical protein
MIDKKIGSDAVEACIEISKVAMSAKHGVALIRRGNVDEGITSLESAHGSLGKAIAALRKHGPAIAEWLKK